MSRAHWKASGLPLTQERLKEFLDYDPETGFFTWRVNRPGRKSDARLGAGERPRKSGGRTISVDGVVYSTARLAWFYVTGQWPIGYVGHRNRNMHDDRYTNLEDVGATKREFLTGRPITAERLRQLVIYDPETGDFRWQPRSARSGGGRAIPGRIIARKSLKGGYAVIGVDHRRYLAHRLAWLYMTGEWPPAPRMIDHINGNKIDNRWTNLRLATAQQNSRNKVMAPTARAPHKGVYLTRNGRWAAKITIGLGVFDTVEEAREAYMAAAREHFGEFARGS